LAVRVLAVADNKLLIKMEEYLTSLEKEVVGKVQKLEEVGWEKYVVKR
jgi:phosphoribosylaminoimidazole carboxylase